MKYDSGLTVRELVLREVGASWVSYRTEYFEKRDSARLRYYFTHVYGKTVEDLEGGRTWLSDLWFVPHRWRPKKERKFVAKELAKGRITRTGRHVDLEP